MFDKLIGRENSILGILNKLMDAQIDFIVVGGYGVSAYRHRFSVDADIIIKKDYLAAAENVLKENGFKKEIARELEQVYAQLFVRYVLKSELPVSVDILVGGIGSRQTDASFSFDEINKHARRMKIVGIEKEVDVKVPVREVLIALKLHAGRLTDFRDIVALCTGNIDLELINKFLSRGKQEAIKQNIKKLGKIIDEPQFADSFKGMFMEKKPVDLKNARKLLALVHR